MRPWSRNCISAGHSLTPQPVVPGHPGHPGLRRQPPQGVAERGCKCINNGDELVLAGSTSDIGWLPTHAGFDCVKRSDTIEDISRQRGRLGLVDIKGLAPKVRPAGPEAIPGLPPKERRNWDEIDQASDESFPSSDPPGQGSSSTCPEPRARRRARGSSRTSTIPCIAPT